MPNCLLDCGLMDVRARATAGTVGPLGVASLPQRMLGNAFGLRIAAVVQLCNRTVPVCHGAQVRVHGVPLG